MPKRITVGLLLFCLIFSLSSCKPQMIYKGENPVAIQFSADVFTTYDGMDVTAKLSRSFIGMLTLDIVSPETIAGTKMTWNGQEIIVEMDGLSFTMKPEEIPQAAMGVAILSVLDKVITADEMDGEITDEGRVTRGASQVGDFLLLSNAENGHLISLEIPSINLHVKFDNFKLSV